MKKKYRRHHPNMIRVNICMYANLLKMVDKAAAKDYTTRSDIIRTALLWYLRPQGRELDQTDTDEILNVLQQRKMKAGVKKMLKGID